MRTTVVIPVALAAAVLAGCGTTVTGGAAPSGSPVGGTSSAVAVPASLDAGTYATTPRAVPPASTDQAWIAEGNRMGDALIQVNEVDPRMTLGGAGLRSFPVLSGIQLSSRVPDATAAVFAANGMKVGMTTTRGDAMSDPTVATRIGLYRFPTDEAAKRAVDAIRMRTAGAPRITVASAPGGTATEFKPGTVDGYLARGPIVVNVSGTAPTTAEATRFVAKAYTLETAKLAGFTPTAVDQVKNLPPDSGGILARTLPVATSSTAGVGSELMTGYFSLEGLLHRIRDISSADDYRKAGVDLVGQGDGVVYRTRDDAAAVAFQKALYSTSGRTPADPDPAVPGMRCVKDRVNTTLRCSVAVGRYVADVTGSSLQQARQKASAEYAILARAR